MGPQRRHDQPSSRPAHVRHRPVIPPTFRLCHSWLAPPSPPTRLMPEAGRADVTRQRGRTWAPPEEAPLPTQRNASEKEVRHRKIIIMIKKGSSSQTASPGSEGSWADRTLRWLDAIKDKTQKEKMDQKASRLRHERRVSKAISASARLTDPV